jgi:hypothetical protein
MRKLLVSLVLCLALIGCAAAAATGAKEPRGQGAGATSYLLCTPYISESGARICRFAQMHVNFYGGCSFTPRQNNCGDHADRGLYPWGTAGDGKGPYVSASWTPSGSGDGRTLVITSYGSVYDGKKPAAKLVGFVSGGGSGAYTVTEAIAYNDQGVPNGDRFYTPDLPGQGEGDPGGPLHIDWESNRTSADLTIEGYLYLRGR